MTFLVRTCVTCIMGRLPAQLHLRLEFKFKLFFNAKLLSQLPTLHVTLGSIASQALRQM